MNDAVPNIPKGTGFIDRVKGKQAPGEELGFALSFYDKYRKLVKAALADPGSTKLKVTQGNLNDFVFILSGLSGASFGRTPMPGVTNHGGVSRCSSLPASWVRPSRLASVLYGAPLLTLMGSLCPSQ